MAVNTAANVNPVLSRWGAAREEGYLVQHWLQVQASWISNAAQVCHQAMVQKGSICCKTCMPG